MQYIFWYTFEHIFPYKNPPPLYLSLLRSISLHEIATDRNRLESAAGAKISHSPSTRHSIVPRAANDRRKGGGGRKGTVIRVMDRRKSKRTRSTSPWIEPWYSVHVSPPRIYRRFYDGCRIPSIRYRVLRPPSFTRPFLLMENVASKNEPVHVGQGGQEGEKTAFLWRGATRPNTLVEKVGLPHPGDERSSLSGRRDYVVVETTLLVCGTERERERKNSIVSARFYTNVCVRIDEYIFPSRKNSSMLQNLSTIWLIVYIIKASDHVKRRSNKSNQEKEEVINLIT